MKSAKYDSNIHVAYLFWAKDYVIASLSLFDKAIKDKSRSSLAPALYLFRHSFELFNKFLSVKFVNNMSVGKKIKKGHDLNKWKAEFRKTKYKFSNKTVENLSKRFEKEIKKDDVETFLNEVLPQKAEEIAKKMQDHSYMNKPFEDSSNENFRYPTPEIMKFLSSLSWSKVKNIKDVAEELLLTIMILYLAGYPENKDPFDKDDKGVKLTLSFTEEINNQDSQKSKPQTTA